MATSWWNPRLVVLADLDGTILDSHEAQARGWGWWANLHGLDVHPFLEGHKGRTAADKIRECAPHLDPIAETLAIAHRETFDTAGVTALPGAHELLTSGRPVAIVTSATRELAVARLRAAGLPMPPALVTAESVRAGKPAPDGFRHGADLLGVSPSDCVVLEDAPAGVRAGRAAHAGAVVGIGTAADAAELLSAGADAVVPDVLTYLSHAPN